MFKRILDWLSSLFTKKTPIELPKENEVPGSELPDVDHKPKAKLGIVVGHTKDSQGATLAAPFLQSEYAYHRELAQFIQHIAYKDGYPFTVEIFFRDGVGISGAYRAAEKALCDAVIELHFNGFNKQVRGTVTLCSSSSGDKEFATIIQRKMCDLFERGGMSRGVKAIARGDRGGMSCYSFPNGVNCLVEPVFGDNPEDAKMYVEKKVDYAKCLLNGFRDWMIVKGML